MTHDFLIVGAGLSGCTFARVLTDAGYDCLVIEKDDHVGGMCYTEEKHGIMMHVHGAHSFHTSNRYIWEFVNRFANFVYFANRHKSHINNAIFDFPINLMTLYQLYGIKTPEEARSYFKELQASYTGHVPPRNFEEKGRQTLGDKLYYMFFHGYTKKHWGVEPSQLPADTFSRLPVRFSFDDLYFKDDYQGVPLEGYTVMHKNMLDGIEVQLNIDYHKRRSMWDNKAVHTIYTGLLDEFFDFEYGNLRYRTVEFVNEVLNIDDYQGSHVVNFPHPDIPWTRILEHKHMLPEKHRVQDKTVISRMHLGDWHGGCSYPFYPIRMAKDMDTILKYQSKIDSKMYTFAGRSGTYRYLDMDTCVEQAIRKAEDLIG